MRSDPRVPLTDIDQAGADINQFTDGADRNAYVADAMMRAAVERKFEIIGEALTRLHKNYPKLAKRIPRTRRIIDFRNLLIHGYDCVDSGLVWDYIQNSLPELRRIVQGLLTELDSTEVMNALCGSATSSNRLLPANQLT